MPEREYEVTVTQDHAMIHRVSAKNANEARRKVERLIRGDEKDILESYPGNVGHEVIRLVEPVVPGPHERWNLRQCIGTTVKGSRCVRRAWAAGDGYLCSQHLWQDGVEE